MPIKQSVAYAIGAMMQLPPSERHAPLPSRVICQQVELPEAYVLQLLRKLRAAGLVHSTRGVQGGYNLIRSLDEVSVMEIYDALGYSFERTPSPDDPAAIPHRNRTLVEQILKSIASELRSCMGNLKIADLR